jgi:hypothetical protein
MNHFAPEAKTYYVPASSRADQLEYEITISRNQNEEAAKYFTVLSSIKYKRRLFNANTTGEQIMLQNSDRKYISMTS